MNLKIFTEKECRVITREPSVRITTGGVIVINTAAMKQMQLAAGNRISMAQDDENPKDWYIFRHADGLEVKAKNGDQKSFGIQSSFLCNEILKSLGLEKGKTCGFKLAPAPTEIDGKTLWALITSKILKA
jgi:hypothetical protein